MAQLTQIDAESLIPEQATALIRVLELQARWENHRDDPAKSAASVPDLNVRQKAFEAFQTVLNRYAAKYRIARLPEPTQSMPERLAIWCRALRAVFQRSEESGHPAELMAKVHRWAARTAVRVGKNALERRTGEDLGSAIRELDGVIEWCDELARPASLDRPLEKSKEDAA
jgi:hypothetical protein